MANPQQNSATAQLEYQKIMLLASLSSVAQQMRQCASAADQFAQTLSQASFSGSSLPSLEVVQAGNGNKRQGTEDDDIDGPTKKRRVSNKKVKDPDAPKRAASSYIFFQNDLRQELRKQHPEISAAEVMSRVSKLWADMTREQKAPYERLQAEAKQKWEAEKRAYDERRGIVATTKPAVHKAVVAPVEEPVHRNSSPPGTKLARKHSESSNSSSDTNPSDKSEGEDDGAGGNSDEDGDQDEEDGDKEPSPPPPKSKARSKAEVATAAAAKSKGKVSSPTAPMPARQEKKKRSRV
ncbi:hypothetical protein EDB85DRAFT_1976087 [Lactarius pseudohatsudake]|nr:hypothetical protein EDB85DRAFT_1976087 [Lactarius pseudohatsudake]